MLLRITDLAEPDRRRESARALAQDLGGDDLLVFVEDTELGCSLPAPGFPQTLPDGHRWQQFLERCRQEGHVQARLPTPDSPTPINVWGATLGEATLVLCGGEPAWERLGPAQGVLNLLIRLLQRERSETAAAGHATAAREAAVQAEQLASALDAARQELQDALGAADREITARKNAEEQVARLWAAEQLRAQRLGQVAAASRHINAAHSLQSVLEVLTEQARLIIGARLALGRLDDATPSTRPSTRPPTAVSVDRSDTVPPTDPLDPETEALCRLVRNRNRPMRHSQFPSMPPPGDLKLHPASHPTEQPTWLAAPLNDAQGQYIGLILLTGKLDGVFSATDEAILVQLVNVASGAIANARLYDQLREADQRKNEFLAMLGHELRNPLAPIRSGLDLLALEHPAQHDTIGMIQDQVSHVVRLVDDLLDLSRIIQGRISLRQAPVEVATIVNQAVDSSRQLITAAGQQLHVSLPDETLWLNADRVRLVQVVGNLLNNASKYSEVGGNIELDVQRAADIVVLAVQDDGMGIDADLLPHIFDLFTQSSRSIDRSQGGLGIGLTLARQLVELHGGTVTATSGGLGAGSRFELRLPLGLPPANQRDAATTTLSPSRRILVVDDNRTAANMTAQLLRHLGENLVEVAHDGHAALEQVERFRPDVMILDIGLPGLDGWAVARELRQRDDVPDLLLVALTGYGQAEDRSKSRAAGFDEHLVKPIGADALRRLLSHSKLRKP